MDSPIIKYYSGRGTDHRGRSLEEILAWNDEALEDVHDFIQWLFPLDEPSGANSHAPILTTADFDAFAHDTGLTQNLRRSLIRMLGFYGFRLVEDHGTPLVERSDAWEARAREWLRPHNHNYPRLTRLLKSLRLLGLPEHAGALHAALLRESRLVGTDVIGSTTLHHWRSAGG